MFLLQDLSEPVIAHMFSWEGKSVYNMAQTWLWNNPIHKKKKSMY